MTVQNGALCKVHPYYNLYLVFLKPTYPMIEILVAVVYVYQA